MTSEEHSNLTNIAAWDPAEWDSVRETPPETTSIPETVLPTPSATELPTDKPGDASLTSAPETASPNEADATPFTLDLHFDPEAKAYFDTHGADTLENAFALANILHTHKHVGAAADVYQRGIDVHSGSPHQHPTVQVLLQVRLLCLLKSGQPIPPQELDRLRSLNLPFANYIEGIALSWRHGDHRAALEKIDSAYDEFHTGEEADWLTLEVARRVTPSLFSLPPGQTNSKRIPRTIFMYWDQNPPEEIQRNFEYHRSIQGFDVKIFDREEAILWLYENYGPEARNIFTTLRHPAESADFLRVHVTQLLGGWWLDADLRIKNAAALEFMADQKAQNVFFVTDNGVVHNDLYGSVSNSLIMEDALLSLYRNCYLFHHLYIAYKTGPGPFTRALNRTAHRALKGLPVLQEAKIYGEPEFRKIIEEFDTPYKHVLPHWQTV